MTPTQRIITLFVALAGLGVTIAAPTHADTYSYENEGWTNDRAGRQSFCSMNPHEGVVVFGNALGYFAAGYARNEDGTKTLLLEPEPIASDLLRCSDLTTALERGEAPSFAPIEGYPPWGLIPDYNPPPATPPGPPGQAYAVAGENSIKVAWLSSISDVRAPVTEYTVRDQTGAVACPSTAHRQMAAQSDSQWWLECTVPNTTAGRDYTFSVTATNAIGESEAVYTEAVRYTKAQPSTPRRIRAKVVGTAVKVSWVWKRSQAEPKNTRFRVTAIPGGKTCSSARRTCKISGLIPGRDYTFAVEALAGRTKSARVTSNTVSIPRPQVVVEVPDAPEPDKPTQEIS